MNERQQHQPADAHHRGIPRPEPRLGNRAAQQQVPEEEKEHEEREGEPGVPGPPGPPDRLGPDRTGGEHHARKRRADLGRGFAEPVEPLVLEEQVQDAGDPDQPHGQHGRPRRGHVDVENLLGRTLVELQGGEGQRPHVHTGEQDQSHERYHTALLRQGHSSTVEGKRRVPSVTNTISYAASNLSHAPTSLKGRPPMSFAVTCTAPTSGVTRNGSSSTRSRSSANRVRITIALNRVPTATKPTVASAITATSGSRTRPTGTLKNRTNSGRPTPSIPATNARLARSFPQYRLVRLTGDRSRASSAWFSSSS